MKHLNYCLTMVVMAMTLLVSACGDDKDDDVSPDIKPTDIIMGAKIVSVSDNWLTDGQTIQVTVSALDYSTTTNAKLTSIKIEKDGNTLKTAPFKLNSSIDIKADNWSHGENTINVLAVFKAGNDEIEINISSFSLIVFNELPKYDIEGNYNEEIKWVASNGEKLDKYFELVSKNHIFDADVNIKWIASNGESFSYSFFPSKNPSFHINQDATNFNAKITKEELHWHTFDGPSEQLIAEDKLNYPVILYGNFTVVGTHENIAISEDCTITFKFVKEKK